jgi:hypothetical protein
MRMFIFAVFLSFGFISAHAEQTLPLFGSEAAGVVDVAQQQASLSDTINCVDETCPIQRKAVIQAPEQDPQP